VNARNGTLLALGLGALAVIAATVAGSSANVLDPLVHPPAFVRAALVGGSAAVAVVGTPQPSRTVADEGVRALPRPA